MGVQKASNSEKPKSAKNDQNNSDNQEDPHIPEEPHLRPIAASTELTTDEARNLIESLLEKKSSLEAELVLATEAALVSELQNDLTVVFLEAQISAETEKIEKFLESLERSRLSCDEVCVEEKTRLREEIESLEANLRNRGALKELKVVMSKENAGLQAKILDLENSLARKEAMIRILLPAWKEAVDAWKSKSIESREILEAFIQEMVWMEQVKFRKNFEIVVLRRELSRLRSVYEETWERNKELVSKVARISDAADEEAMENEERNYELESEVARTTDADANEVRVLRESVREYKESNNELVSEVERITKEAGVLRESAREYKESNNELVSEVERKTEEVRVLRERFDGANGERERLDEELKAEKEAVSVAKHRLDEELNMEVENRIAQLKKQHEVEKQDVRIDTKRAALRSLEETANMIMPSRSNNYAKKTLDKKTTALLHVIQGTFEAKQNENKALKESEAAAKKWKSWSLVSLATIVLLFGVVCYLFCR